MPNGDIPKVSELRSQEFNFSNNRNYCVVVGQYIFIIAENMKSLTLEQKGLRQVFDLFNPDSLAEILVGVHLIKWVESHLFCSKCSSSLKLTTGEIALQCESCQRLHYPQISPVAIVLVTRIKNGVREFLLAKGLPPRTHYSCLAGFVEAGESVELCAQREVFEETGVFIRDLKYFGSQAWPFPSQLMLGFTADWESGEIHIDENEIADAQWFTSANLPQLPPQVSLARQMIESFLLEP